MSQRVKYRQFRRAIREIDLKKRADTCHGPGTGQLFSMTVELGGGSITFFTEFSVRKVLRLQNFWSNGEQVQDLRVTNNLVISVSWGENTTPESCPWAETDERFQSQSLILQTNNLIKDCLMRPLYVILN